MNTVTDSQINRWENEGGAPLPQADRFPGFWISIGWIAMYMGFQLVFGIIAIVIAAVTDTSIIALFKGGSANPEVVQAAFMGKIGLPVFISVLLAGLVTLAVLWRHLRPDNRKELIGLFAPSRLGTWQTIGIGVALMAASYVLNWLYGTYVVDGEEMQAGVNQLIKGVPKTPLNHLILFATIALIAPVLEELLFRGYLQTSLMRTQKPWLAIVIASAVFGVIHFQPLAFPVLMLMGAAFGYLYYLTGSLRTNIALHVINNSLAYLAMASGVSSGS
jgi:uncharacterized protein